MDARIEGQLGGIVQAIPTRDNGPTAEPHFQTPPAARRATAAVTPAVPAPVFDANGDGAIESWSYAHGGDSYTTFKPPPSGAVGSNLRHVKHELPSAAPVTSHATRRTDKSASTVAAIHHAHAAYQRDGAGAAPDAPPPSAPAATPSASDAPVSSAPVPAVTQPAGAPPLPFSRS